MSAVAYPDIPDQDTQDQAIKFFSNLCVFMQCKDCRLHWADTITQNPPTVNSKADLVQWLFNVHNTVNKKLGTLEFTKEQLFKKISLQSDAVAAVVYYPSRQELEKIHETQNAGLIQLGREYWSNFIADEQNVMIVLFVLMCLLAIGVLVLAQRSN